MEKGKIPKPKREKGKLPGPKREKGKGGGPPKPGPYPLGGGGEGDHGIQIIYINPHHISEVGGKALTGKSFRFVRACVRAVSIA